MYTLFLIDVPSRPVGPIVITHVTNNAADLSWKPPTNDGGKPVTSYIIEFKLLTRTFWSKAGSVDGNTTAFTITRLMEEADYLFRVIAVNEEGQSPPLEAEDVITPMRKIGKFLLLFILYIYIILKLSSCMYAPEI